MEPLLVDLPEVVLPGQGTELVPNGGLVFTRTYRAAPERVMQCWSEPARRAEWLSLPSDARFICIAHVFPTSLQAHIADGVHSARIELLLSPADDLTALKLTIVPHEPLSRQMLISAGYADRWEELLYMLADVLTT
ncbi:MAG: hypothetical protein R2817_00520 [Flavobacteriales bacterium]